MIQIKPLAFYLPQYHPIAENDLWWGKGFTEWTNVGKAKPLYKGHRQPKIPMDLGYYDLRVPEVREQQAEMARNHGVYGFIYYHYWFGDGKQVLERVANEVLSSGKPDFPFCFCWANETWSGIWHGLKDKTLVEQTYPSDEDIRKHFEYLLPFFRDNRYIKVNGKPVFIVYNGLDLKERGNDYLLKFKKLAEEYGFNGLHLVCSNLIEDKYSFKEMGYDAKISFAFNKSWYKYRDAEPSLKDKFIKKVFSSLLRKDYQKLRIQDARKVFDEMKFVKTDVPTYPQILPNWDNTPRSGRRGVIIDNCNPTLFDAQIKKAIKFLSDQNLQENFLVVKSWNEWAEGNILEPEAEYGYEYLDVLKKNIYG